MCVLWLELISSDSSGIVHMCVHFGSSWSIMTAVGEFICLRTVT